LLSLLNPVRDPAKVELSIICKSGSGYLAVA
jgi:hypothetical protein